MWSGLWRDLLQRYAVLLDQTELLTSLRKLVDLPAGSDLSEAQWSVLEAQLAQVAGRISTRLKEGVRRHVAAPPTPEAARSLNALLARSELAISRHTTTFDLLLDLLTQRSVSRLGPLLAGCDELADDALRRDQRLGVFGRPIVFLDRGFGASILRQGVPLPAGGGNSLPLIQIPYSKLATKHTLTSVVHEAGHQALEGLGLTTPLAAAVRTALSRLGAPPAISNLYALWMKELGPDFWGFGNCGVAQASSIKEILSLTPEMVFAVTRADPHPPPYLRVLCSLWWCRVQWGRGYWLRLEHDWRRLYPLASAPAGIRGLLAGCRRYIPAVSRVLFAHPFSNLSGKPLPALFDLRALHPSRLRAIAANAVASGRLNLHGLPPCGQLALFRVMRDERRMSDRQLDRLMSEWLVRLGSRTQQPTWSSGVCTHV